MPKQVESQRTQSSFKKKEKIINNDSNSEKIMRTKISERPSDKYRMSMGNIQNKIRLQNVKISTKIHLTILTNKSAENPA